MDLMLDRTVGEGGFATIFEHSDASRAVKVFRRMDAEYDGALAGVFASEVEAFVAAARHQELAIWVPRFFGQIAVSSVLDVSGNDVSGAYHLNLAYVMERIHPVREERKFGAFFDSDDWPDWSVVEQLFTAAGIDHTGDASVLNWRSGSPKVIDFAMQDVFADWVPDS
jgi:hypothetical protein